MKFDKSLPSIDLIILSLFLVFITAQPFFLHHEIIMMDTGIHFPAINALLHGEIPYKDFLFIRGPLELYVPALMMKIWGSETALLPTFFYVGSVLALLAGVLLAWQIFQSRLILYLMVPVLVARTFPRISYYYWGGMRYFLGLMAIACAIQGFKKQKTSWMFAAGVVSCLSLFTTIEAGISTVGAITIALAFAFFLKALDRDFIGRSFKAFVAGGFVVLIPYCIYLLATGSFWPYLEITYIVPAQSGGVLSDARGGYPETFWWFILSLFPGTKFFKFMTPFYCYIAIFMYLGYRIRKHKLNWEIPALVTISIYGLILFFSSFRAIQGHHFEMALQPEKILLFFLIERVYFFMNDRKKVILAGVQGMSLHGKERVKRLWKVYGIRFMIFCLIGSSLGYSIQRYNHRFTLFRMLRHKLSGKDMKDVTLLHGQETRTMTMERVKGMTVPRWQAEEIEGVVKFLRENTAPEEETFYYPEVGNFAFWADRPFVGRFPIGTFSWIEDRWHRELVNDFKKAKPKYVIMTHLGHRTFPAAIYFRRPKNIPKFKEVTKLITDNYVPVKSFEAVAIYQRKE